MESQLVLFQFGVIPSENIRYAVVEDGVQVMMELLFNRLAIKRYYLNSNKTLQPLFVTISWLHSLDSSKPKLQLKSNTFIMFSDWKRR